MKETNTNQTDFRKAAERKEGFYYWGVCKKHNIDEPVFFRKGLFWTLTTQHALGESDFDEIDETPITRPTQSHRSLDKGKVSDETIKLLDGLVSDVSNLLSETDYEWQSAGYYMAAKEFLKSLSEQPEQKQ